MMKQPGLKTKAARISLAVVSVFLAALFLFSSCSPKHNRHMKYYKRDVRKGMAH